LRRFGVSRIGRLDFGSRWWSPGNANAVVEPVGMIERAESSKRYARTLTHTHEQPENPEASPIRSTPFTLSPRGMN
jgi:hypothetical protein